VPSHSERVRRNYENGWWTRWQERRRAGHGVDDADDASSTENTAPGRRNAV